MWLRMKHKGYAADWKAGCQAENEAQRLCCRLLQTGEQAVFLRIKLQGYAVECCRLESRLYGWE